MRPSAKASNLEVAWVPPENYHLTLKYLGWCRLAVLELLKDELSTLLAKDSSFEIRMRGVGAFPAEKKARVFWVGLERGERELAALAKKIDEAMAEFGFEPEKRAFVPHVTLGRFRKVGDATNLVLPFSDQNVRGGRVERITLYESFQGPKGTHYHRHAHWPLAW